MHKSHPDDVIKWKLSASLALFSQRPVTWRFDVSFLSAHKQTAEQTTTHWWFETPSRSLWFQRNVAILNMRIYIVLRLVVFQWIICTTHNISMNYYLTTIHTINSCIKEERSNQYISFGHNIKYIMPSLEKASKPNFKSDVRMWISFNNGKIICETWCQRLYLDKRIFNDDVVNSIQFT